MADNLGISLNNRGLTLWRSRQARRGRSRTYDKAVAIYTRLGRSRRAAGTWPTNLARSLHNRGKALRALGKLRRGHSRIMPRPSPSTPAWSSGTHGTDLSQRPRHEPEQPRQRPRATSASTPKRIADYDKAVAIYTRLVEEEGRRENLVNHLALSLRNLRGDSPLAKPTRSGPLSFKESPSLWCIDIRGSKEE